MGMFVLVLSNMNILCQNSVHFKILKHLKNIFFIYLHPAVLDFSSELYFKN